MASVISTLKSFCRVGFSLQGAALKAAKQTNCSSARAFCDGPKRIELQEKFGDLECRISKIGSSIKAHSMHIANPPRRYTDYSPSKTALSELQQKINVERANLKAIHIEFGDFPVKCFEQRVRLVEETLEHNQTKVLLEMQNVEQVILSYGPSEVLHNFLLNFKS